MQLRRIAKTHRLAGIDQRVEVQILFLEEQLEKQPIEPGVGVPIDKPQIIAGDVDAEIGELDALTFAQAAALPLHAAAKYLAADQFQLFELGQQFGAQDRPASLDITHLNHN